MKTTEKDVQEFLQGLQKLPYSKATSEADLFQDHLVTYQQKKRDEYITDLLNEYVSFYKSKVKHSRICRYIILIPCVLIIVVFAFLLVFLSLRVLNADETLQVQDVVAFVTACISFISLIISLLTIITKYFFPENDEQYITAIVESIQKNDLENKRENARSIQNPAEKTETKK